jgi:hypothetical protein
MEGMKASMHLLEPKHFVTPFLAHALGSLVGGLVAALIAASRKITFALVIGIVHMVGGIAMVIMLPAPLWFEALDLIVAYIPMALVGGRLGSGSKPAAASAGATK